VFLFLWRRRLAGNLDMFTYPALVTDYFELVPPLHHRPLEPASSERVATRVALRVPFRRPVLSGVPRRVEPGPPWPGRLAVA
jgi:hypothetical protein